MNPAIILQGRAFEMTILFLNNGVYHGPEISLRAGLFLLIAQISVENSKFMPQLPKNTTI